MFKSAISVFVLIFLISGCYREPEFSNTPTIEFLDISKVVLRDSFSGSKKDSVMISIKFQDGDGDMGLTTSQIEKEFKAKPNYLVKAYRSTNGKFNEVVFDPTLSGFYPKLKTNTKVGPIEGTLNYAIDFLHPFTKKNDTMKFEIRILDRALNVSNAVETKAIVLNSLI